MTVLSPTRTISAASLFRVTVEPTAENGLTSTSQVMVDKFQTPSRQHIGAVAGRLDDAAMHDVEPTLTLFPGLA